MKIDAQLLQMITTMERMVEIKTELISEEDEQGAVALAQQVKKTLSALEKERKREVDPINKQVKAVNDRYRPVRRRLEAVERKLKSQIGQALKRRQEANQQALQAAGQAAQTGGDASAHLSSVDDRPLPPSVSARYQWTFEIIDPSQLPGNFWSPDPQKIAEYLKQFNDVHNPPTIPGVNITYAPQLTIRQNRGSK